MRDECNASAQGGAMKSPLAAPVRQAHDRAAHSHGALLPDTASTWMPERQQTTGATRRPVL
jgi:hypothetical protein